MIRKLILVCSLCLLSAPAFATEADFEKRMARGVTALDAGNPMLAEEEFRAAVKEHPNDPEAALYLAIALNRAADPTAETALKSALRLDPDNPRINFELGTFYYNKKMFDEAGDYFDNLLAQKPEPTMKTAAVAYIANIRSRSGVKRWGATLTGGMQYDSNVPLVDDGVQLPVGTDRKGDLRGVLNLGFNGAALRNSEHELTGSYSLYQTLHVHLNDFNLTQNLLDVTYKRNVSPLLTAKISGDFESILLGGDQFVNDFSVTPGLFATFQEGMMTGFEYIFRNSYFKNTPLFTNNSERDGMSHSLVLSHRQALSGDINLRVSYTFERELADVSSWSAISNRGTAGIAVTLPHAMLFDISFDAIGKKYDEIQANATKVRSDTTLTAATSLTWQAYDRLSISAGYHYTDNSSNIDGYDYNRGITSVMFQGRY